MRHQKLGLIAALFASSLLVMAPTAPASSAPISNPAIACETVYWGSTGKSVGTYSAGTLHDVRTGRHNCFDRLVVDLNGKNAGYSVKYVNKLYEPGSGKQVKLTGGAMLAITVNAPAYNSKGEPTYLPGNKIRTLNYSTFKQQAFLGSFEGQTELAVSTRAKLPMRAFILDGPGNGSRLVVDVAHYWY